MVQILPCPQLAPNVVFEVIKQDIFSTASLDLLNLHQDFDVCYDPIYYQWYLRNKLTFLLDNN